jgi:general secretion pathway protein E
VFSTLHTNSAVAAIDRLLDLGVRPLLITAALNLVVAQRLARRICQVCRTPYAPPADMLRLVGMGSGETFYHGAGCPVCAHTGYAGRVGIFEMLRLTPALKALVRQEAGDAEIVAAARGGVTRFLLEDATRKVRAGLTTVEEVTRVMQIDRAPQADAGRLALGVETPGEAET